MATYESQQLKAVNGAGNKKTHSREFEGKLTRNWWEFNTTDEPTATIALADSIRAVLLKKGTKIYGGKTFFEAVASAGTVEVQFGLEGADGTGYIDGSAASVADDPNFFTTANLDISAAGEGSFGVLQEDNPGYELLADCWLTFTLIDGGSGAIATDKDINGYVDVVVGN
jgi:hypothetical protein